MKKPTTAPNAATSKSQRFPLAWNEKRVKQVIAFYDRQTEDEELAEYEAAMRVGGQTTMMVPTALVPAIRRLIARHQAD
jgi:hypothetical protein